MKPIGLLICQSKNTPPSERAKGAGGGSPNASGEKKLYQDLLIFGNLFQVSAFRLGLYGAAAKS